jgi:hypothetical protein
LRVRERVCRIAGTATGILDLRRKSSRARSGKIAIQRGPTIEKGDALDGYDTTTRRQTLRYFGGAGMLAALATAGFGGLVSAQGDATPAVVTGGMGEGLYVVVRTWAFKPDKSAEELAALVREGFVPIISETPGSREYYNVWNGETRQWMAVSVFADKAGADESTARAQDWAAEHVADYVEADPTVVDGQIVLYYAGAKG